MSDDLSPVSDRLASLTVLDDPPFVHTIAAQTPVPVLTVDADDRIVFANPAIEPLTGYPPTDLVGQPQTTILAPDTPPTSDTTETTRPPHSHANRTPIPTPGPDFDASPQPTGETMPVTIRHHDGSTFPITLTIHPHPHPHAESQSEADTTESHALLTGVAHELPANCAPHDHGPHTADLCTALLAASPGGHAVVDPDGTITHTNDAFSDLLGVPTQDTPVRDLAALPAFYDAHGTPIPPRDQPFTRVAATGTPIHDWECMVQPRDTAPRWLSISAAPLTADSPTAFLMSVADHTHQHTQSQLLRQHRDRLDRVRQVTESLRSLNHILVEPQTTATLKDRLCEQLSQSEAYCFAWYGDYQPARSGINPVAWGSTAGDYIQSVDVTADTSPAGQGPTGQAIRTQSVCAVRDISNDPLFQRWRDQALAHGFQSGAAIPIMYQSTVYGVLAVYSSRTFAFDDYEHALLSDLGKRIGHAMHAAELQRLLHTDTVTELTFTYTPPDHDLIQLTAHHDCHFHMDTMTPTPDGNVRGQIHVDGLPPETVHDTLAGAPHVEQVRTLRATGEQGTIEYTVGGTTPCTVLLENGATLTHAVTRDGTATITCQIASDANTRRVVTQLQSRFPSLSLAAKETQTPSPADTTTDHPTAISDQLTDRQYDVLKAAYQAGYFNTPRETTGDTIADSLNISAATFSQHIRKALQTTVDTLFTTHDDE